MQLPSLAHPAQAESTEERREAEERFGAASRVYYLLADTGCPEERLERAGRMMDHWARKLRVPS
jgi:hypothetical protein